MDLIPAVDIRGGKCVRLYQGDYSRETVFAEDPVEMAMKWEQVGSKYLHVVDLDGARDGSLTNSKIIKRICAATSCEVQVGGGIRSVEAALEYVGLGVSKVILGTAVVKDPGIVRSFLSELDSDAIVVSVDSKDGLVSSDGWVNQTSKEPIEFINEIQSVGICRCLYTDIRRDGTLEGPNYGIIKDLVSSVDVKIMVAGGIATISHLRGLDQIGVEAAIVGRAIYTGDLDLEWALNELK